MIGTIDFYAPCFCGSGKKYRFCCMPHVNALAVSARNMTDEEMLSANLQKQNRPALELYLEGQKKMGKKQVKEAEALFEQALSLAPDLDTFFNNLMMCYLVGGRFDEALTMTRKRLATGTSQNPYGMSLLAQLLYMNGEEAVARNTVYIAANQERQTPFSVDKICETMAFMKLHRDILALVDSWRGIMPDATGNLAFFAGVAAANLGDNQRAIRELSSMASNGAKAEQGQRILKRLEMNEKSQTLNGDWLYFQPGDFMPYMENIASNRYQDILWKGPLCVNIVETFLAAEDSSLRTDFMELITHCVQPSVTKLLKKIINWPLVDSEVFLLALAALQARKEITEEESSKILNSRQAVDVSMKGIELKGIKIDPNVRYGGIVPEGCEELYRKLIQEMHRKKVNLLGVFCGYSALALKAPDYFPFQYNLAGVMQAMGQNKEAEEIFRHLAQEHPEYIFAHSGVLETMLAMERVDEAREYISHVELPKEMHPDAACAYFTAVVRFYVMTDDFSHAKSMLDMLETINPKDRQYLQVKEFYKSQWRLKNKEKH